MIAILPTDTRPVNARRPRSPEAGSMLVVTYRDGRFAEPVRVRWYASRSGASVHCNVWVHGCDFSISGAGVAGGYGYHKESAALDAAIRSAGIVLSESIDGCGDSGSIAAVEAIARALGYTDMYVVRS